MNFKTNNTKPHCGTIWQTILKNSIIPAITLEKKDTLGLFLPKSKNSLNSSCMEA